jgi:hypothetical protein
MKNLHQDIAGTNPRHRAMKLGRIAEGRTLMKISIYPLGSAETIQDALLQDGWQTKLIADNWIEATHPHVADEEQARERLYPLGLLTTGTARIELEPFALAGIR